MLNRRAVVRRVRIESLEQRVLFAFYGPDNTFGAVGKVNVPGDNVLEGLSDGTIFAVGNLHVPGTGFDDPGFNETIASHILADGSPDTAYDTGGSHYFGETRGAVGDETRFYIVFEIDANGSDVRAYHSLTAQPDNSFSGDGSAEIPFTNPAGGGSLTDVTFVPHGLTPDGGILIRALVTKSSPFSQTEEFIKFKPDGTPDSSFGDNGIFIAGATGGFESSAFLTSNAFYLVRYNFLDHKTTITRYQTDAKNIDTTFGTNGVVTINNQVNVLPLDSGKILTLEIPGDTSPQVLSRLNANGQLDPTFGTSGHTNISTPNTNSQTGTLQLDDQGRIVVVSNGEIFRFSSEGAPDTNAPFQGATVPSGTYAFDSQGRLLIGQIDFTQRFDVLPPVQVTGDGVLHVNGSAANDTVTIESAAGNKIKVTLNGNATEHDAAGIVGLNIALDEGTNSLVSSIDLPSTVTAGDGVDSITTGDGADSINSPGADVIVCGDGNDTVFCGGVTGETANVTGGDGNKLIRASGGGRLVLTLGVGDNDISFGNDGGGGGEITIAGGSNDIRENSANAVITIGGSGNNKIQIGVDGTADITTGSGDDFIDFFGGGTAHGGAGDDSFRCSSLHSLATIFGDDGNDKMFVLNPGEVAPFTAHGGNGNDRMTGGDGTQMFYGEAGNDTMFGGGGSDLLSGGGGNDRLFGEGGNDRLYGGDGRDRLFGGNGDDRIFGGASGDWLYANTGNDQLNGEGGGDRLYADYSSGVATLHGNAGNDILVTKDSLVDHLFGDRGSDTSIADASGDVLTGIETVS